MKIINVKQGSDEWHRHRQWPTVNASDVATMMGIDKHRSRDDLIRHFATGVYDEISSYQQKIFDDGHENERMARLLAEKIVGSDLFPVVGQKEIAGILFSASFDGIVDDYVVSWEHKSLNISLAEKIPVGDIDMMHQVQMTVQQAVSGAGRTLFMASKDGCESTMVSTWYTTPDEFMNVIIAAVRQFQEDVEHYVHVEPIIEPIAEMVQNLPAIKYSLNGLQIQSNLAEYKKAALVLVEKSKIPMETDQEFANAELLCKKLRDSVGNIKSIAEAVINEVSDIAQFRESLLDIGETMRLAALNGEKQVNEKKRQLKSEIIKNANILLHDYCHALDEELDGGRYLDNITGDFIAAAKGYSKIDSIRSSVNDELARAKIEAGEIARTIRINLEYLKKEAADYRFLFADYRQLVTKNADDLENVVRGRIAQHKVSEAEKREAEEKARIKKDQEKIAADERRADEEKVRENKRISDEPKSKASETIVSGNAFPTVNQTNDNLSGYKPVGEIIIDSLVENGIPPGPAARVAKLIVEGKITGVVPDF